MAELHLSNATAEESLDLMLGLMNDGGAATMTVYGNNVTKPATADDPVGSASVIVAWTMANPAFADATPSGDTAVAALDATGLSDVSTGGDGDSISFIRIVSGSGTYTWQFDVSTTGNGGAIQFDSLGPVSLGQTVTISSGTISLAEIAS